MRTAACRPALRRPRRTSDHGLVAAHTTHAGGRDRLAIDHARAGLGIAAHGPAHLLAQRGMYAFPGAIEPPLAEVVVDGLPGWELLRQQPPLTAGAQDVGDTV